MAMHGQGLEGRVSRQSYGSPYSMGGFGGGGYGMMVGYGMRGNGMFHRSMYSLGGGGMGVYGMGNSYHGGLGR